MKKKIIFHSNYEQPFEDRRSDNMKVKEFFTPTIIITIIVAAIALGGYKFIIAATAETVKCHTEQIATTDKNVSILDNKIGKIETEIPNIKESIQRIETSQIEIQKDIKKLLSRTQ